MSDHNTIQMIVFDRFGRFLEVIKEPVLRGHDPERKPSAGRKSEAAAQKCETFRDSAICA